MRTKESISTEGIYAWQGVKWKQYSFRVKTLNLCIESASIGNQQVMVATTG